MAQPNHTQLREILLQLSVLSIEQVAFLGACAECDIDQLIIEKALTMYVRVKPLEMRCTHTYSYGNGYGDWPDIAHQSGIVPVHWDSVETLLSARAEANLAISAVRIAADQKMFAANSDEGFLRSDIRLLRSEVVEVLKLPRVPSNNIHAASPRGDRKVPPALNVLTIEQASSVLGCAEVDIEDLLRFGRVPAYVTVDVRDDVVRDICNKRSVRAVPEPGDLLGIVEIDRSEIDRILTGRRDFIEFHHGQVYDMVNLAEGEICLKSARVFDRGTIRVLRDDVNRTAAMAVLDVPVAKESMLLSEVHRQRCRAIAELLWERDPHIRIRHMAESDQINGIGCEKKTYDIATIERWIRDLCPAPKPGRPRKPSVKGSK